MSEDAPGTGEDAPRDTDVAVADGPGDPPSAAAPVAVVPRAPRDPAALVVTAVVAAVAGAALWAVAATGKATVSGAPTGALGVVIAVGVLQGLLVLTWITGLRVPGRIGGIVVCLLAAAAADVLAVEFPRDQLGVLVPPLGLLVLAIFVVQLMRGVVRVRVVESVSDVAMLGIAVVALAAVIALQHRPLDPQTSAPTAAVPAVVIIAAALVLSALGDLVAPLPRFDPTVDRGLLGVLLAAVAGGVAGYLLLHDAFGFGPQRGAFLGAALGIVVGLLAVGSSFIRHGARPVEPDTVAAEVAEERAEAVEDVVDDSADADGHRPLAELAAEEVLVEEDAEVARGSVWPDRLAPVAAALWAIAISAPVGYLLTVALGG